MSIPSVSSTTNNPSGTSSFSIFGSQAGGGGGTGGGVGYGHKSIGTSGRHVMQLIAHASLDVVEDVMWSQGGM